MSVLAYMGYYYYDMTYLLVILGAVLSMIASAQVNSTFKRYSRVRSSCGMTGAEAAERILYRNGLTNVRIEHISGNLTDHYDPSSKVLRLSDIMRRVLQRWELQRTSAATRYRTPGAMHR